MAGRDEAGTIKDGEQTAGQEEISKPQFSIPVVADEMPTGSKVVEAPCNPPAVSGSVVVSLPPPRYTDDTPGSFKVGNVVQGKYKNGIWYDAVIADTQGDKFVLIWDDGDTEDTLKGVEELRHKSGEDPFNPGDKVRARRNKGFVMNATVLGQGFAGKYSISWEDGEMSDDEKFAHEMELQDGTSPWSLEFVVGDIVQGQSVTGRTFEGLIVRRAGDRFVVQENDTLEESVLETSRLSHLGGDSINPNAGTQSWMPPVSSKSNSVEDDVMKLMAAKRKRDKAVVTVLLSILAVGCFAGWVIWIALPIEYIRHGRHTIRDTYTAVNCTVLAQSCWKKCSGCNCPDSCCESPEDCVRSNYFMSQRCVWLSQSKYEQDPRDFSAKVNIRDDVAGAGRASWGRVLAGGGAMACGVGARQGGRGWWLWGGLALSGAALVQGKCECAQSHEISMTVAYEGNVVTKTMVCSKLDGRAFCKGEAGHRDESCSTLEDLESKEHCQESYLNRVGQHHQCFLNPADPTDLEIAGSKPVPAGTIVAITLWGVATLVLIIMGIVGCCTKGRCCRGGDFGGGGTHCDCGFLCLCI